MRSATSAAVHAFLAVLEQDRELVAAEAGGGVGRAQAALEPLAHLEQQLVARRVTEGVVDRLEVVEVHEQHGDRLVLPRLTLEGVRDAVVEQRPVRERRHRVVEGLVGELLLELLALGHVAGVQHDALHVRVVQQVRAQRLGVHVLAVAAPDAELDEAGVPLGIADRRQELQHPGHVVGVDQVGEPRALDCARVEAEHPSRRRARVGHGRVGVDHADHVGRVAHERGEARLALLDQQVLGERGGLEREGDLRRQRAQGVGDRARHLLGGRHDHQAVQLVPDEQRGDEDRAVVAERAGASGSRSVLSYALTT